LGWGGGGAGGQWGGGLVGRGDAGRARRGAGTDGAHLGRGGPGEALPQGKEFGEDGHRHPLEVLHEQFLEDRDVGCRAACGPGARPFAGRGRLPGGGSGRRGERTWPSRRGGGAAGSPNAVHPRSTKRWKISLYPTWGGLSLSFASFPSKLEPCAGRHGE